MSLCTCSRKFSTDCFIICHFFFILILISPVPSVLSVDPLSPAVGCVLAPSVCPSLSRLSVVLYADQSHETNAADREAWGHSDQHHPSPQNPENSIAQH